MIFALQAFSAPTCFGRCVILAARNLSVVCARHNDKPRRRDTAPHWSWAAAADARHCRDGCEPSLRFAERRSRGIRRLKAAGRATSSPGVVYRRHALLVARCTGPRERSTTSWLRRCVFFSYLVRASEPTPAPFSLPSPPRGPCGRGAGANLGALQPWAAEAIAGVALISPALALRPAPAYHLLKRVFHYSPESVRRGLGFALNRCRAVVDRTPKEGYPASVLAAWTVRWPSANISACVFARSLTQREDRLLWPSAYGSCGPAHMAADFKLEMRSHCTACCTAKRPRGSFLHLLAGAVTQARSSTVTGSWSSTRSGVRWRCPSRSSHQGGR